VSEADGHLSVPTKDIVEWTRTFVRHPSPQTERFEHEPQVQSFIAEQVAPLVQALGLPWRRDPMGNLLVELGPERADKSLMLMAYAMTHPANRMPNPYAGELIEDATGAHVRGRGVSEQKGSLAAALAAVKTAADTLRRAVNGDTVTYVVTRNINYTNICYFRCQFCAFSKGKLSENLRGRPYNLDMDEIVRRVAAGATRRRRP